MRSPLPNDELNCGAHSIQLNAQVVEHASRYTVAFAHQPQKYMLRAYVVVIEALSFFLRKLQCPTGSLGEFLEAVGHANTSYSLFYKRRVPAEKTPAYYTPPAIDVRLAGSPRAM